MDRTREIFDRAGVQALYVEIPVRRIFANIRKNKEAICSPSWYKLTEREAFAKFSLVIHRDRPHIVLAASRVMAEVQAHKSLSSLLGDRRLRLGVVANVSYGPQLDRAFKNLSASVMREASSVPNLAKMVAFNHGADFMLIDREDHDYIDRMGEMTAMGLQPVDFPDMPPGLNRYLMCSKLVDDDTMARLDRAIRELYPQFNDPALTEE
jgi:polar amino acid transport system substrate-binding protein